jgi:phosphoribosyl 1,2-cyclic phosphate phosphodiesterase
MPFAPLPDAADLTGKLRFLGTGTSVGVPAIGCGCPVCTSTNPKNQRTRCGLALGLPQGTLLVDTTPDLRQQLLRERIALVHSVLYTHEHADHLFGLDDVRVLTYYLGHKLPLYCEEQVEARIRRSFDYAFGDESETGGASVPHLEIRRITLEPFDLLGVTVIPMRLHHGKFRVLGFRFGNVAYCTDVNGIPEASLAQLQGLDVLILDALRQKFHPTHFNVTQAVEMAKRLGAKRTYFTHMAHDLEHEETNAMLPPGMELAYDGLEIDLT